MICQLCQIMQLLPYKEINIWIMKIQIGNFYISFLLTSLYFPINEMIDIVLIRKHKILSIIPTTIICAIFNYTMENVSEFEMIIM